MAPHNAAMLAIAVVIGTSITAIGLMFVAAMLPIIMAMKAIWATIVGCNFRGCRIFLPRCENLKPIEATPANVQIAMVVTVHSFGKSSEPPVALSYPSAAMTNVAAVPNVAALNHCVLMSVENWCCSSSARLSF